MIVGIIGRRYNREKKQEAFKGNQYTKSGSDQIEHHQKTSERLAEETPTLLRVSDL